jgi:hypothetical protein
MAGLSPPRKNPTHTYVLLIAAWLRACSSRPLIVNAAFVMLPAPFRLVSAGTSMTSITLITPITTINSSSVKARVAG